MRIHSLLLLCLAASLLGFPQKAQAQQQRSFRETPSAGGSASDSRAGANLPAWAQPNQGQRGVQPSKKAPHAQPPAETNQPTLPPRPAPVPLGGLEWLAVAGGAYAINRMRRRNDDDDDDGNALP